MAPIPSPTARLGICRPHIGRVITYPMPPTHLKETQVSVAYPLTLLLLLLVSFLFGIGSAIYVLTRTNTLVSSVQTLLAVISFIHMFVVSLSLFTVSMWFERGRYLMQQIFMMSSIALDLLVLSFVLLYIDLNKLARPAEANYMIYHSMFLGALMILLHAFHRKEYKPTQVVPYF
jgi:hypothetical protein